MKKVRVTIELPERFIRLLNAKAELSNWTHYMNGQEPVPQLDAGDIVAWLVLMEARGAYENDIHAATPMAWRDAESPEIVHDERRVYVDGVLHVSTTQKTEEKA